MTREEEAQRQTDIRRALLANGYTPLANSDKRCMLKGWPRIDVTEELIETWSHQWAHRATGLRLENGLAAADFDIDDAEAMDEIINTLPDELWAKLEKAPKRAGKGAKEAWLFRAAEPFTRSASRLFAKPGVDPEAEDAVLYQLEVFGGESPRQFGAYGAHTIGPGGEIAVAYRWLDDWGPHKVPLDALPELTKDEVYDLCRHVTATLERLGWTPHQRSKDRNNAEPKVYDLTEDMVFDTMAGEMTFAQLSDWVQGGEPLRLSASWLDGPAARNKTRCIASMAPDGTLQIFETAGHQIHKPKQQQPFSASDEVAQRLEELRRQMERGGTLFGGSGKGDDPKASGAGGGEVDPMSILEQAAGVLLRDFAFCPSEQKNILPIPTRGAGAMSLGNFRTLCAPLAVSIKGPRGGVKTINPVEVWQKDPARINVIGTRFWPRSTAELVDVGDGLAINTYRAVQHDAAPEGLEHWAAFLRHLLPDEGQRAWFEMWLAAKVQRPWAPNCGVIMVAKRQGTGRGTLFDMLRGLFGGRHVSSVTSMQLMGGAGQGQYTDWLENALLVTCDEVLGGDDGSGVMAWRRRETYERLKTLVDPRARSMQIVRKSVSNYEAEVYASFLLATNNINALPISREDRRFAVLTNAPVPLKDAREAWAAVSAVRTQEGFRAGFLAALWHHLAALPVDWDVVREAPMTSGREEMLEANESDLEEILDRVLGELPGDFIESTDLRRRLGKKLEAEGLAGEIKNWWVRAQDLLKQDTRAGWARMPLRQRVTPEGAGERKATVYYRVDGPGIVGWGATAPAGRSALLALGNDLNATLTRAQAAFRERGWGVHEGGPYSPSEAP